MYNKIELISNIALIIIGLTLGIIFYISNQEDLSIVLFSIALASILYQFLGGIGESNSFHLGAVKFGGSAAIIIGFMFFLKQVVFVPTAENYSLSLSPDNGWIPVNIETGRAVDLTICNQREEIKVKGLSNPQYQKARKNHEFQISNVSPTTFSLQLRNQPTDTAGYINIHSFNTNNLFNKIEIARDSRRIQVFTLYPEDEKKYTTKNLNNVSLPFAIETQNIARFNIGNYFTNQEIIPRTSYIVPYSNKVSYIVFLEQADSREGHEKFSKWLVEKIEHNLQ